ncbi:hypothetical protein ACI8AC_09155 [Geodermatophilus sp. SYSU D00758]
MWEFFVTHDFDEAVKLGDRIVVFDVGARIVQYDTPEAILAEPAEEYVADFVGAGGDAQAAHAHPGPQPRAAAGDDGVGR